MCVHHIGVKNNSIELCEIKTRKISQVSQYSSEPNGFLPNVLPEHAHRSLELCLAQNHSLDHRNTHLKMKI